MALGLPSCREVARRAASGELDAAGAWSSLLAMLHLAVCGQCRRFGRQLRLARESARLWAASLVDARRLEALEARLLARLKGGSAG